MIAGQSPQLICLKYSKTEQEKKEIRNRNLTSVEPKAICRYTIMSYEFYSISIVVISRCPLHCKD